MNRYHIAIVLFSLCFSACGPSSYFEREIAGVDSLLYRVDTSIARLGRIDTLPYARLNARFSENTNFVQAWYMQRGDTIARPVAMLMAEYRELKKPFQKYSAEYDRVEAELVFTKDQLAALKHDLSYNLLDTAIVRRVYFEEMSAAEKVIADVQQLDVSNSVTKRKLTVIEPRIDSLINALKSLP